jgi:autotransporter adhesin
LQLTEFGRNFPIVGNNTSGFAFPTATGADALAAGFGATAAGTKGAAFGTQATASGASSVAIGAGAQATKDGAIAVGLYSAATGINAIAIGVGASATGSIAVGAGAQASNGGAAFGDGANASGSLSTALGPNASAAAGNSVAIGAGSIAAAPNTASFGSPGNERRLTNVAAGINPTDGVNVSQLSSLAAGFQSQVGGLQSQINNNDRRLRDGVAVALAAGGVPAVPYGRKLGVFGNVATYDGHGAAGFGLTGVLLDTKNYQVQGHGSVGIGFDTSVVGGRGGVAVFW